MFATRINDRLSIAAQPSVADIERLGEAGFSALVNLRPEGEEGALGTRVEKDAAAEAGLPYIFLPLTLAGLTDADVDAFRAAVTVPGKGPVLAHCRTGHRALALYAIIEVLDGRMTRDQVLALGDRHGMDLTAVIAFLDRRAARRPQVKGFFDPRTWSVQYVVSDPETSKCAIIDPVLDYDEKSGQTAIGDHVVEVQALWKDIYNWPELRTDGSYWDHLFKPGEHFKLGSIDARVMFSPGHTLASITYVIGDAAFVHDTIFMPDSGASRAAR